MNHADLARLRPMMPVEALAQVVDEGWKPLKFNAAEWRERPSRHVLGQEDVRTVRG